MTLNYNEQRDVLSLTTWLDKNIVLSDDQKAHYSQDVNEESFETGQDVNEESFETGQDVNEESFETGAEQKLIQTLRAIDEVTLKESPYKAEENPFVHSLALRLATATIKPGEDRYLYAQSDNDADNAIRATLNTEVVDNPVFSLFNLFGPLEPTPFNFFEVKPEVSVPKLHLLSLRINGGLPSVIKEETSHLFAEAYFDAFHYGSQEAAQAMLDLIIDSLVDLVMSAKEREKRAKEEEKENEELFTEEEKKVKDKWSKRRA